VEPTAAAVNERARSTGKADDYEPTRMVGISIPLGPLGLTLGIYRHRVLAFAVGLRRWMR
jgi:hypothetical protein